MDITRIIVMLIGLLSAVVTGFLIPLIKSKLTEQQQAVFFGITKAAVYAAEQIFGSDGVGAEKKDFVIKYLMTKGVKADSNDIDIAIESAVKELKISLE